MINIHDLNLKVGNFALKKITFDIGENEFFVLMGPTGAGKTMLLETIAGINTCDSGKIIMNNKEITNLPPEKRSIGIVYQDCALFPHINVKKNITYGVRYNGINREESKRRLALLSEDLNLEHLLNRLPVNLSGGEKQRVALARAMMVKPELILLDEPFSNLDPRFRDEVKEMIRNVHRTTQTTFVMVTHDFDDARELGERGAIIRDGLIEQVGKLNDIFENPKTSFVTSFVGF